MNIIISYCPICGKEVRPTDTKCTRCGYESYSSIDFRHEWTHIELAKTYMKELYTKWISKYNYYI